MTSRRLCTGWASALALLLGLGALPLRAAEEPATRPPVAGNLPVLLGTQSRLPYPLNAERWVDAVSTQPVSVNVPGTGDVSIRKQSVLVFRPIQDALRWDDLVSLEVSAGILPAGSQPRLQMARLPAGETDAAGLILNTYEDRVYHTGVPGEHLVLGMIRNLRSQHLLVYAVLLQSKLEDAPALLHARRTASSLAEQARRRRLAIPVPAGATAAAPVIRFAGAQLRQLQDGLTSDITVSATIKRIAVVVFPQATSVTRSVWRTREPLADRAFLDFYSNEARRLGWGSPISRDETHVGKPTLLFQRPYSGGVVMLRAQPTPGSSPAAIARPSTTIFAFEIDGNINVAALLAPTGRSGS